MQEKALADKRAMTEKTKESDFAINYDRVCIQQDREDRINKERYLQQFRNENKRVGVIIACKCSWSRTALHTYFTPQNLPAPIG